MCFRRQQPGPVQNERQKRAGWRHLAAWIWYGFAETLEPHRGKSAVSPFCLFDLRAAFLRSAKLSEVG
jgi:hypothetical protein